MRTPKPSREHQEQTVRPMGASGIPSIQTRALDRAQALRRPPARVRSLPWLNGWLFFFLLITGTLSAIHRWWIDVRFARSVVESQAAPFEIQRIRRELSEMALDEKSLRAQLDARLKYAQSLESASFYIVLDRQARRFTFRHGDRVVRESSLEVGAPRTIRARSGQSWTFAPLTGAFNVRRKLEGASWRVPPWIYAMKGMEPPRNRPSVPDGLGRYVLVLTGDYVIHSPPASESPLRGVKPGSFLVPEEDLAAIWKRVGSRTRVYIF